MEIRWANANITKYHWSIATNSGFLETDLITKLKYMFKVSNLIDHDWGNRINSSRYGNDTCQC